MRILRIIVLAIAAALTCSSPAYVSAGVAEADSAYARQDYVRALESYEQVTASEGISPQLLFNMGNAAYYAGDYGRAMLAFERASRLAPRDREIRNNLLFLRNKVEDANKAELKGKRASVSPDDTSFFRSLYEMVAVDSSSDMWAVWGAVCFVIAVVCLSLYVFMQNVTLRKVGFFGTFILAGLSLLFVCFSFMAAARVSSVGEAIVTEYKVPLLSRPDEDAGPSSAPLVRGTKVDVLDTEVDDKGEAKWYKVRLNHDYVGWIRVADAEVI